MNDLFMLPPLTASYSKNIGPKVTLAYAELVRLSHSSQNLFVPWNSGGRKFEKKMQGNYDILMQEIDKCKEKYQKERLLPEQFYEATELDIDFKEIVFATLSSGHVQDKEHLFYNCKNCNKKILSDKSRECKTCGSELESIIGKEDLLFFGLDNLKLATTKPTFFPRNYARFTDSLESPYIIKVFRESEVPNHWFEKDKAFNQRFVSIHWPIYAHKKYSPDVLHIFCGSTVEYKWLLPSLCLLTLEELQKTSIYIHGFLKSNFSLEKQSEPEYKKLILSSSNIGNDINIDISMLKRVQRMRKKLDNINIFLDKYAKVSNKSYNFDRLAEIALMIDDAFRKGKNRTAFGYINKYLKLLSQDLIPEIRSKGITESNLNLLKRSIENVKRYYN